MWDLCYRPVADKCQSTVHIIVMNHHHHHPSLLIHFIDSFSVEKWHWHQESTWSSYTNQLDFEFHDRIAVKKILNEI